MLCYAHSCSSSRLYLLSSRHALCTTNLYHSNVLLPVFSFNASPYKHEAVISIWCFSEPFLTLALVVGQPEFGSQLLGLDFLDKLSRFLLHKFRWKFNSLVIPGFRGISIGYKALRVSIYSGKGLTYVVCIK